MNPNSWGRGEIIVLDSRGVNLDGGGVGNSCPLHPLDENSPSTL